jgi:hypothetical protein
MKKLSKLKFNKKNLESFLEEVDKINNLTVTIDGDAVEFDLRSVLHYWGFYDIDNMSFILRNRLFLLNENPNESDLYDEYFKQSLRYYSQKYYKSTERNGICSHEWSYAKINNEVIDYLRDLGKKHKILEYRIKEPNWLVRIIRSLK